MRDRDLGGDVCHFVTDIRWAEETGRTRNNTWGKPGDRMANRRMISVWETHLAVVTPDDGLPLVGLRYPTATLTRSVTQTETSWKNLRS